MPYMLSIDSVWSKAQDDDANIAWSRGFWSAMQRHSTGRLYLKFAGHGEDADLVRQAHGTEVYTRLAAIKRTYERTNFFRMNQTSGSPDRRSCFADWCAARNSGWISAALHCWLAAETASDLVTECSHEDRLGEQ